MSEIDQVEKIIVEALGMEVRHLSMRSKKTEVVELRFIAVMVIKNLFKISYRALGRRWNNWEHDRIISMRIRGQELVEINDPQFMKKYIIVMEKLVKYMGKKYCQTLYIPEESSTLVSLINNSTNANHN